MEMDSHEERLHNMIQDSKREAAKEEAGRRAKELREKQKEAVSERHGDISPRKQERERELLPQMVVVCIDGVLGFVLYTPILTP